jgi:2,3-bisphosphoglycerate-independent phosphoglycerate mutase
MKYVFFVPDGAADYPVHELDGKTPLEYAETPNLDFLAREGRGGLVQTIPEGMGSGSDIATLSLMGYDPREYYTGRGPLEAAYRGIRLRPGELAFRCNLVTESDGLLVDYSAGHISTEEATVLIETLDRELGGSFARFYPGVSYRHLLILLEGGSDKTVCRPPHDVLDKPMNEVLPSGEGAGILVDLMEKAKPILAAHEINRGRIADGKNPANMIWPWGQGTAPRLIPFKERFGLSGAVISAVDVIKGIGYYMGLRVIEVPGATGYFDTDYEAKARFALKALEDTDFVFIHAEAPDEAGHEGLAAEKVKALENFDARLVAPVLEGLGKYGDYRIIVSPDHETPLEKRTHTRGPVPFVLYETGGESDGMAAYSEREASSNGSMRVTQGHDLIHMLLKKS